MVACEAFESLESHVFSDMCRTNKRKQNYGHRSLQIRVLKWKKGDHSVQENLLPVSNQYAAVL
jgi:hypothetical protein